MGWKEPRHPDFFQPNNATSVVRKFPLKHSLSWCMKARFTRRQEGVIVACRLYLRVPKGVSENDRSVVGWLGNESTTHLGHIMILRDDLVPRLPL